MTPALSFVFEARFLLAPAVEIGSGPDGVHRMIPITGGTVTGPRLSGVVMPGGADWQRIRPDGTAEIEARYVIRTGEGALISVLNRGIRHGPAEVMKQLAAGINVDPASYYFRTTPEFRTATGQYEWLTRSIFIASGERGPDHVILRVWSVD